MNEDGCGTHVICTGAEIFRRGINEYIYILCPAENVISGKMVQF